MPTLPLASLTIKPYGLEVFTDLQRKKEFTTLYFRRKDARLETNLAFVGEVLADLSRAGLTVAGTVKTILTPRQGQYRCHIKVTVTDAEGQEET